MAKLPTISEIAQEVARLAVDECEYEGKTLREWIEIIKTQPANGTDLISRQQAIDALCAVCGKACDKSKFVYNAPQDEQVILCPEHYCLCTLSSAQPEIVHCRDCRYNDGTAYCELHYRDVKGSDFCSWGER